MEDEVKKYNKKEHDAAQKLLTAHFHKRFENGYVRSCSYSNFKRRLEEESQHGCKCAKCGRKLEGASESSVWLSEAPTESSCGYGRRDSVDAFLGLRSVAAANPAAPGAQE